MSFRFGHSQLREVYTLNGTKGGTNRILFDLAANGVTVTSGCGTGLVTFSDLRGNQPVTNDTRLNFSLLFSQMGHQIDTLLSPSMFQLPPAAIGDPPLSLAERNLRRGQDFRVPFGQQIAAFLRQESIERNIQGLQEQPGDLSDIPPSDIGIDGVTLALVPDIAVKTPLWYYILREAKLRGDDGERLGPIGSRIVAESIMGLLSEPIPPGGCAGSTLYGYNETSEKQQSANAQFLIQSSRFSKAHRFRGVTVDNLKNLDLDDSIPAEVRKIQTFKDLTAFVEANEEKDL